MSSYKFAIGQKAKSSKNAVNGKKLSSGQGSEECFGTWNIRNRYIDARLR